MIRFGTFVDKIYDGLPKMIEHAISDPEKEVVGVVLYDEGVVPLQNEAEGNSEFYVSEKQFANLEANHPHPAIIGFYHSHLSDHTSPSERDIECMMEWFDDGIIFPWVIVNTQGEASVYKWDENAHYIWNPYNWQIPLPGHSPASYSEVANA